MKKFTPSEGDEARTHTQGKSIDKYKRTIRNTIHDTA